MGFVLDCHVLLFHIEQRKRHVQALVEQLALDTGFMAGTDGRVE